MVQLDAAMLKPSESFKAPREVLAESWPPEDKYRVLRQWQYDIGQLHLATEENMAPPKSTPDPVTLADIHAAMTELGYKPDSEPSQSKGA